MSRYVLFEDVITELAKHMMWEAEIEYPYASDNIEDWKQAACMELRSVPTADVVEVVRCKDCIYYEPPHVEEYSEDAFDSSGVVLVHIGYGVNVGGRCCVDDMKGYSEDKRVFVNESNYCGRAIRKKVTE